MNASPEIEIIEYGRLIVVTLYELSAFSLSAIGVNALLDKAIMNKSFPLL